MDVIVLAKAPVPGRVKTRLCPPCTPEQAARLATAALTDTLRVAMAAAGDHSRVIVGLDGSPGPWCPPDAAVVDQGTGTLADRLATVWSHARGPSVQIGMDTPQVDEHDLRAVADELAAGRCDAVLGLAQDGGWWCLALSSPRSDVFAGIPTSRPDTGTRQLERLRGLGLRVALAPERRDVDTWTDAVAVAADAPTTAFAAEMRTVTAELRAGVPA